MNKRTSWLEKWRKQNAEFRENMRCAFGSGRSLLLDRDAAALELAEEIDQHLELLKLYPKVYKALQKLRAVVEGEK